MSQHQIPKSSRVSSTPDSTEIKSHMNTVLDRAIRSATTALTSLNDQHVGGSGTISERQRVGLAYEFDQLLEYHHNPAKHHGFGLNDATFERARAVHSTCLALENIDGAGARGGIDLPEGSIGQALEIHSALTALLRTHLAGFLEGRV